MKKLLFILGLMFYCVLIGQNNSEQFPLEAKSDTMTIDKNPLLKKLGEILTPVSLQWQYAGNIGMHSVGADWNVINNVFRAGLMLGYVPDSRSIEPLFIGTIQLKYTPNVNINIREDLVVKPLNFTFNFSSTFGDRFSIYNDLKHYPDNYYWWNVRTRYGIAHDVEVLYSFKSKFAKGISFYLNSSMWDIEFYSVFGNDNLDLDRLPYKRLFTLGIGTKIYLN